MIWLDMSFGKLGVPTKNTVAVQLHVTDKEKV